ncbi:hypothetical protein [Clostridium estertheticum]|uniref:hypothetical protein n=1 Tax=Clostridium estertheticum TaxID=238834 RepID=UPI001C0AAF9F|nr:hypothetical protein [Clostridium estertheticum]MBU3186551.1 hypothetical protein [Clostridium estertheticum]
MVVYELDVEGTQEDVILNRGEVEAKKDLVRLNDFLEKVDLSIYTSMRKVGNSYITTASNKKWFSEEYGLLFSKVIITDL